MRRLKARPWVPILAASLFVAACSRHPGRSRPVPNRPLRRLNLLRLPPREAPRPRFRCRPILVVETAIPGVVAAGTPMVLIKTGFEGAEGPVGMPDGSVLFTETRASRDHPYRSGRQHLHVRRALERVERPGLRCAGPADLGPAGAQQPEGRRPVSAGQSGGARRQLRRQALQSPQRHRHRQEGRRVSSRTASARTPVSTTSRPAARRSGSSTRRRIRTACS